MGIPCSFEAQDQSPQHPGLPPFCSLTSTHGASMSQRWSVLVLLQCCHGWVVSLKIGGNGVQPWICISLSPPRQPL
jgi:hypothetical protein